MGHCSFAQHQSCLDWIADKEGCTIQNDWFRFDLGFDLHGPDCGAPDCYTTHLSLSTKLDTHNQKINDLEGEIYESGCSENQAIRKVKFEVLFCSASILMLKDEKNGLMLVIEKSKGRDSVMLFESPAIDQLTADNYKSFLKTENELYPYTSAALND